MVSTLCQGTLCDALPLTLLNTEPGVRSLAIPPAKRGRPSPRSQACVHILVSLRSARPLPHGTHGGLFPLLFPQPSTPSALSTSSNSAITVMIATLPGVASLRSLGTLEKKESQHAALATAFEPAGWISFLLILLVPSSRLPCFRRMHPHAISTCHSLVCACRHLERQQPLPNPTMRTPTFFYVLVTYPIME